MSTEQEIINGQQIKRGPFADSFGGPTIGHIMVKRLLEQMALVPGFVKLFGKFTTYDDDTIRWASYDKFDWTLRQLPVVSVYEKEPEIKQSSNAYMNGSIAITVFWPPNLRRPDLTEIPRIFKGALQNFFESDLVKVLLDPHPTVNVTTKVPGLNELGKELTWSPQVEGIVANEAVPVTILDIKYRLDLRAWYRYLETLDYTKENPFEKTLADFTRVEGEYDGLDDSENLEVVIPDGFDILP